MASKSRAVRRLSREQAFVEDLARLFKPRGPSVQLGIGDDAAVLTVPRGHLVWTIDTSVEDVHFRRSWISLSDIGYRAAQAAISDIAAMGATPVAILSNLALPAGFSRAELKQLAQGQDRAAREHRCPVVGGNLARADTLSVTTTVLGKAKAPLVRAGARAGDELWLLGDVGLARAGLLLLERGTKLQSRAVRACIEAWRCPRARIKEGLALVGRAHAAIDISDGLAHDAAQLASASKLKVVIDQAKLTRALPSQLQEVAKLLGTTAFDLAVQGGEDYALLASGPSRNRPKNGAVIGEIATGRGTVLRTTQRDRPLTDVGFDHFR